jgi:hypothetical protein
VQADDSRSAAGRTAWTRAGVRRELGGLGATYQRWRDQFGGLKAEVAKQLKDLEPFCHLQRVLGSANGSPARTGRRSPTLIALMSDRQGR